MAQGYSTKEVADMLSVDKSTLLRWIRQKKIEDVKYRDGKNWRVWFEEDIKKVREYYTKNYQLNLDISKET